MVEQLKGGRPCATREMQSSRRVLGLLSCTFQAYGAVARCQRSDGQPPSGAVALAVNRPDLKGAF